jgi:hypothetical protein
LLRANPHLSDAEKPANWRRCGASASSVCSINRHRKLVDDGVWRMSSRAPCGAVHQSLSRRTGIAAAISPAQPAMDDENLTTWRYRHPSVQP